MITAHVTAVELGIDLDAAIDSKLQRIYTRGWRDARPGEIDEHR